MVPDQWVCEVLCCGQAIFTDQSVSVTKTDVCLPHALVPVAVPTHLCPFPLSIS
eukprot:m.112362 g.112362  ORF g.112362 m.112362 type:complete len:54 (-) comp13472_c0_seq1:1507-1668(-)